MSFEDKLNDIMGGVIPPSNIEEDWDKINKKHDGFDYRINRKIYPDNDAWYRAHQHSSSPYRRKLYEFWDKSNGGEFKDGTYDIDGNEQNLTSGYQTSFYRKNDDYNDKEHDDIINEWLPKSSGKVMYGVYGGNPELSLQINDLNDAKEMLKKYHQNSIWDNARQREILYTDLLDDTEKEEHIKGMNEFNPIGGN